MKDLIAYMGLGYGLDTSDGAVYLVYNLTDRFETMCNGENNPFNFYLARVDEGNLFEPLSNTPIYTVVPEDTAKHSLYDSDKLDISLNEELLGNISKAVSNKFGSSVKLREMEVEFYNRNAKRVEFLNMSTKTAQTSILSKLFKALVLYVVVGGISALVGVNYFSIFMLASITLLYIVKDFLEYSEILPYRIYHVALLFGYGTGLAYDLVVHSSNIFHLALYVLLMILSVDVYSNYMSVWTKSVTNLEIPLRTHLKFYNPLRYSLKGLFKKKG